MENAYMLEFTHKNEGELMLNFCGYSMTEPLHGFGPAVRPHYIIHFVISGKGDFYSNGRHYSLSAGQGFLIEPDVQTFYCSDEKEPWSYIWVGFSGSKAGKYLNETGISSDFPVFSSEHGERLKKYVFDMIKHSHLSVSDELRQTGMLYLFLSAIAESSYSAGKAPAYTDNIYIQKAVEFIQNNYCEPVKVNDIADYICINRSYLSTLFQKYIGMPPMQYLKIFRLTKAAEMLRLTEFTIESIAFSCGYSDTAVFARAFRQFKGMPPGQFRKYSREKMNSESGKDISGIVPESDCEI